MCESFLQNIADKKKTFLDFSALLSRMVQKWMRNPPYNTYNLWQLLQAQFIYMQKIITQKLVQKE